MALVSIVIPVFNGAELTHQCLDSLRRTLEPGLAEVVVVDNGSSDGTAALLRSQAPFARTLSNPLNLGFAAACNQGARATRGRYVLFLNNDTVALPGWLEPLLAVAEASPAVSIVGSRLLYPDGTIQHAGVAMSRVYRSPYHIYCGYDRDDPRVSRQRELRAVTGACMLIRRTAFESAGGFDEGYRNGFEDVDLCLSVRARAGRVIYEPRSVLYHLESQTPGRKAHDHANLKLLRSRWGGPQWTDEDLVYFEDGMRCRMVNKARLVTSRLELIENAREHAALGEVARVQAHLHMDGYLPPQEIIKTPEHWPAEPSILGWGEQITAALGLNELSTRFRAAATVADLRNESAGRPVLTRAELAEFQGRHQLEPSAAERWPANVAGSFAPRTTPTPALAPARQRMPTPSTPSQARRSSS